MLVESILNEIVGNHIINNDVRDVFIGIDAYHQGEYWEETSDTNDWDKLTALRLTAQFSWETEDFINQS